MTPAAAEICSAIGSMDFIRASSAHTKGIMRPLGPSKAMIPSSPSFGSIATKAVTFVMVKLLIAEK